MSWNAFWCYILIRSVGNTIEFSWKINFVPIYYPRKKDEFESIMELWNPQLFINANHPTFNAIYNPRIIYRPKYYEIDDSENWM